jgi:Tol biopolymer transport system component
VSVAPDGSAGDAESFSGTEKGLGVSAGGRYVVFSSYASNLVLGDRNGQRDVFVRDVVRGRTVLASVGVGGVQGDAESRQGSISADGRYVAFNSLASNLVPGDDNGQPDVFVRDLWRGRTTVVSVAFGGGLADLGGHQPELSADGRYVAFTSSASDLVPGDATDQDVFVRDLVAARTELVSVGPAGSTESPTGEPSLSADGRYVAFVGRADLIPGAAPAPPAFVDRVVYVRDRRAGTTRAVSYGVPVDPRAFVVDASNPMLSGDGRVVIFLAIGWLGVGSDPIGNVWARDLRTGTAELISADPRGRPSTVVGSIHRIDVSADGRYVAFDSAARLTAGDADGVDDVFRYDRRTGRLAQLTAVRDRPGGRVGNGVGAAISDDGAHVAFETFETYLWSITRPR